MKLALINSKNNRAHGDEGIVLAYARRPGAPWRESNSLPHEKNWTYSDSISVNFNDATALVSTGNAGGQLRVPGSMPLVLVLCHAWSGILDLRVGPWAATFDLHRDHTCVLLIDVSQCIAVEVEASHYFKDGKPTGRAMNPVDLIAPALEAGRAVVPLQFQLRILRSLNARGLIPGIAARGIMKLPGRAVIASILTGMMKMRPGVAQGSGQKGGVGIEDRVVLLSAAVDGLSRHVRKI